MEHINEPFALSEDQLTLTLTHPIVWAQSMVHEICENLPEYSYSLQCHAWDYDNNTFRFYDPDERKTYVLTMKELLRGYVKYLNLVYAHRERNGRNAIELASDPGQWDSNDVDAMIQMAIFGEIIYG